MLNKADVDEFRSEIGSSINGFLPIEIEVGRNGVPKFDVKKQGKGKNLLQGKSINIALFIGARLSINHIPAVRTADEALNAVLRLTSSYIRQAQSLPEYKAALETIDRIQKPLYDELEAQLSENLRRFLPSVKSVSLDVTAASVERALRSVDILIDDGQVTPLKNKGDGVISLVGMALLAKLRQSTGSTLNTILAIEEPESHLHPRAVHGIRDVLDNIGEDYQVIVTTHSPLLADRLNVHRNVIVQNSKARLAKDIGEIREALGVRVSDNLSHARVVVVCEGPGDGNALEKLLSAQSSDLEAALRSSELSFYPLGGAGKLSYVVTQLQHSISEPICFLDDDQAAKNAFQAAKDSRLITSDETVFTSATGMTDSELEDLIKEDLVTEVLQKRLKIKMDVVPKGLRKRKFSVRCKAACEASGHQWDEGVKSRAKAFVGELISQHGMAAIDPARAGPIIRLREILEEKLGSDIGSDH